MIREANVDTINYKHSWYFIPSAIHTSKDGYEYVMQLHRGWFNVASDDPNQISPTVKTYTNQLDQVIPCSNQVYEFITELKNYIPDVDFLLPKAEYMHKGVVVSLVAYRPGDLFALGEIGHYDPSILKKPWDGLRSVSHYVDRPEHMFSYIVSSPYIVNTRYREDSRGAFVKSAKNLETTIRNVKKYMRSYSPLDSGYALAKGYTQKFREMVRPFSRERAALAQKIMYGGMLDRITKALSDIHTNQSTHIMDSEAAEVAAKYEEVRRKEEEAENREVKANFVMVARSGAVYVTPFMTPKVSAEYMRANDETVVYQSINEVPQEVLGATATLDMVSAGEYVEGVGMRMSERAYWVEV